MRAPGVSPVQSGNASSTSTAPLSATNSAPRAAGYVGSSGRYAAPAFHTPHTATANSRLRSRHTPTTDSTPTPDATKKPANASERASNPRYVNRSAPHTTATASGVAATDPANAPNTPPDH